MKTISRYIMTLALLITAATGAWADGDTKYTVAFKANGNTKTVENVTLPHTFELDPIIIELYPSLSGGNGSPAGTSASGNTNVTAYYTNNKHYATISASFEGAVTVTGQFFKDFNNNQYTLEINCMEKLVAINDDKTEATMESMPTYDLTVDYELVRDMSVQMQAQVGDDATKEPRYRVQWNEEKDTFEPADMDMMQVLELFSVYDGIEGTTVAPKNYRVSIYAVDAEGNPTGEAMDFTSFTFEPGIYAVKAVAADGSDYDGETALSNTFQLFQGYEVEVAAKEFITYYKDEPLYVEDEAAELYTIQSVSGDQAVLSDKSDAMPSNTPMLVYNKSNETKTFLLIPVDAEPNLALTVFSGFKGTLVARTTDDTSDDYGPWNKAEGTTYYALNGLKFVYVNDAIAVGANRCWLEIGSQAQSARNIKLVFGEATGINGAYEANGASGNSDWYDLSGRKLNAAPTRKGVFIKDGKKIVIK